MFEFIDEIPKQHRQVIITTFFFGLFTGGFVYLTMFMPSFSNGLLENSPERVDADEFTIQGSAYGACTRNNRTCPSYRITTEGMLSVIPESSAAVVPETRTVGVSQGVLEDIRNELSSAPLDEYSQTLTQPQCEEGATHYRYRISLGAENYQLDTCRTDFPTSTELAELLRGFFYYQAE